MGCLLALVAAFSARLALFFVWLFTDRLTIAFRSGWEGLIGFVFLPYATLFYALVYAPGKGVDAFGWVIVALGVLFDLSSHVFGQRARRRRERRVAQP
jgi:thiosulfate reductase cytochrome b subunit